MIENRFWCPFFSFFLSFLVWSPGESATPELQAMSSSASAAAASFFIVFPVSVFKLIRTFANQTAVLTMIFKFPCVKKVLHRDYVNLKSNYCTACCLYPNFTHCLQCHLWGHITDWMNHTFTAKSCYISTNLCQKHGKSPIKHNCSIPHQACTFTLRPG